MLFWLHCIATGTNESFLHVFVSIESFSVAVLMLGFSTQQILNTKLEKELLPSVNFNGGDSCYCCNCGVWELAANCLVMNQSRRSSGSTISSLFSCAKFIQPCIIRRGLHSTLFQWPKLMSRTGKHNSILVFDGKIEGFCILCWLFFLKILNSLRGLWRR